MDWLRSHPALPHTVASMAERAAMSPRTLQRQFQQATGMGPLEWLIRERVALVKEMLEVPACRWRRLPSAPALLPKNRCATISAVWPPPRLAPTASVLRRPSAGFVARHPCLVVSCGACGCAPNWLLWNSRRGRRTAWLMSMGL
jgi:hypothetical protein